LAVDRRRWRRHRYPWRGYCRRFAHPLWGAGNDTLLIGTGTIAASTSDATTIIDGGDGFDTVSAALINAANAAHLHMPFTTTFAE